MGIKTIKGQTHKMAYNLINGGRTTNFRMVTRQRAEGYTRETQADRTHFLNIARGSCAEVETQLFIAEEAGLLDSAQACILRASSEEISRMLHALRARIRNE
jgi:four helix bundle protein